MRRTPREESSQINEAQVVAFFEACFTKGVLFAMMLEAEAHDPTIRRFQGNTTICAATDVSALDRELQAAIYTTGMFPDPGTVSRAFARCPGSGNSGEPFR